MNLSEDFAITEMVFSLLTALLAQLYCENSAECSLRALLFMKAGCPQVEQNGGPGRAAGQAQARRGRGRRHAARLPRGGGWRGRLVLQVTSCKQ